MQLIEDYLIDILIDTNLIDTMLLVSVLVLQVQPKANVYVAFTAFVAINVHCDCKLFNTD